MELAKLIETWSRGASSLAETGSSGNMRVVLSLLRPAVRGFVLQKGKSVPEVSLTASHRALFDWRYQRDQPKLASLYSAAKRSQWNAEIDLDWTISVDPQDPERELVLDDLVPLHNVATYRNLSEREQRSQRYSFLCWLLSQFLHGEQGALFAACQVTEAISGLDGKLFGSSQVVDEGRHVEVFHRYLTEKLGKVYEINDNLYVVIDALMTDSRWDIKFLGMQIMIEGLALGIFATIRQQSREPLLRELLKYVITDEARHVHYGVVALGSYYTEELDERARRDREDWAYEMARLLRNRFLVHEFYDEFYAHVMSRRAWDKLLLESDFMMSFRMNMFRRIVPNLKRIGLLSPRIRPHYEALGLLAWEDEKAAPELTAEELIAA